MAIAALAAAGLHDAAGTYYDYGAVTKSENGWTAHFCLSRPVSGVCTPETADSFVEVVPEGSDLAVVRAGGAFPVEQRSRLLGYREPAEPPVPREIYGPFSVVDPPGAVPEVTAASYWTGAIPSKLWASCHVEIRDAQGSVIFKGMEFDLTAPKVEGARDGVFSVDPAEREGLEASTTSVICGEWKLGPSPPGLDIPSGPEHVLASGELAEDERGDQRGTPWRFILLADETRYCWSFQLGEGSFPGDFPGSCSERVLLEEETPIGSTTYQPGNGPTPAIAYGEVSADVQAIEFRSGQAGDIRVEVLRPPAELHLDRGFFVAFLPASADCHMVALDSEDAVLETKDLCKPG